MCRLPRLLVALLLVTACDRAAEHGASVPAATDAGAEVAELVDGAWQRLRQQTPYLQVRTGSLIRELPDLSPAQAARDVAHARLLLERLDAIPTAALDHEDTITALILRWDAERVIDFEPFYWLTFPFTPYQAGFGLNFVHGQFAAHPFSDPVAHPENYRVLLEEYGEQLEQILAHAQGQVARGIFLSRHALPGVVGLFRSTQERVAAALTVSPERLATLSNDQRTAFLQAVQTAIDERIVPGFDAIVSFFDSDDYQARAPAAVGLAQYPEGAAYYRALVKYHTTTDIGPEALHELGKQRVGEIEAQMAAIRQEVGFDGTKTEFHQRLRTDPKFFAKNAEEVEARFQGYIDRIEPLIPDYFYTRPRAPYGVQRLPATAEASMTFGYYSPPTPAQATGLYFYNGSKLDQRPQISAGPLIYHELVPGHHFHIALQAENERLPLYRREYLNASAFTEGWGNYGALLATEMGLLDDPYDRYGAALFDLFITARLVLDTGMNLFGWTLEEGRAYMREHTFQSETEIVTETLRYATDLPGQALAYKAGLEGIVALREKARAAADTFDIRDFHDAILGSGSMPMVVLEMHISWYFSAERDAAK